MLKKIGVEHLKLGMHLHEFCGSWMEHPFWRTKFVINSEKDLELIRASSIREVWIDIEKGDDVEAGVAKEAFEVEIDHRLNQAAKQTPELVERVSLAEEAQRAAKICAKSKEAVLSMFQEARMGKAVEAEQAMPLVEEINKSVERNPGALISLARLKTSDNYTYLHSIAVCALMIALGKQMKLDDSVLRDVGMAGLFHDMGKAMIPNAILNKPGKLTDAEFDVMKTHPAEGHRLLLEGGNVSDIVLDVCLHHHEKVEGSGYPEHHKGEEISLYAKMGAVCDVYDAITSDRPYKAGWDPAEALRKMVEWSKGHFDETVFQAFVKSMGIYPIGSFVRLESGRLGVVIEQSAKSLLTPKVKVFFSTKSQAYIKPEIVDLNHRDKIAGREDAAKWGIKNLAQYWAGDAIPK